MVPSKAEVLKKLEEKWDKVSLQINWKLEPCTKPKDDSDVPTAADANCIITPDGDATYPAIMHDKNIIHTPMTEKSSNQPSTDVTNQPFLSRISFLSNRHNQPSQWVIQ